MMSTQTSIRISSIHPADNDFYYNTHAWEKENRKAKQMKYHVSEITLANYIDAR